MRTLDSIKLCFLLPVLLTGAGACSYLDEEVRASSQKGTYYKTTEQIVSGLNGCYLPLRSVLTNPNYFVMTEGQSDIIYSPSTAANATMEGVSPRNPQMGKTMWNNCYAGVMRCNAIYAALDRADLSDREKAPLYAEVVIMRAFYYYILTSGMGDVPYYTEEVTDENNARITHLGRMSASKTRNACIDELYDWLVVKHALPFVPTYSGDNPNQYRAGAAVGLMLAGKMCLWEERWSDAIEILGYLEDIYGNGAGNPAGSLDAYPISDIPFYNKYVPESIFELSNISTDFGLNMYGSLAASCEPIRSGSVVDEDEYYADEDFTDLDDEKADQGSDQSDYYNGVGIPWLGGDARTHAPLRPNTHFYQELMPATAPYNDKRRAAYNPYDGKEIAGGGGYMAWGWPGWDAADDRSKTPAHWLYFAGTKSVTGRPYLGNKFWCPNMQYNMDTNNYKIFRFAGALICLAEAWLRKGDEAKACDYLNAIKARAGLPEVAPTDFSDAEALMEEIRNEGARELFGEFNRKFDLVRWGIWYDYIQQYSNSSRLKKFARPCHRYYPIPDEEITYSGGNLDNNEYNLYGL